MSRELRRIRHMLHAIQEIERYAIEGEKISRRDELVQAWIVHHLQILGEAARSIEEPFRNRYPEVPWPDIIGMRHVLVHEYRAIDLEIVQ